jgi:nitrate reductase gamma subunit
MAMTTALYTATILFLAGIAVRVFRMFIMPVHVRWELYPIPSGFVRQTGFMLSEILLFKGLFDHNRSLWIGSWLFHIALYLLTALAGISLAASSITAVRGILTSMIAILAPFAFIIGTAGVGILILMRLGNRKLRPFTTAADLANLSLLFVLFGSGLIHTWIQPDAPSIMVMQAGALLRTNPAPLLPPAAWVHLCCIALFIAYFPFTSMAHSFMKYFTYHAVRWDERPASLVTGFPDRLKKYLAFPVSWSARHVHKGNHNVRWIDVVQEERPDRDKGAQE